MLAAVAAASPETTSWSLMPISAANPVTIVSRKSRPAARAVRLGDAPTIRSIIRGLHEELRGALIRRGRKASLPGLFGPAHSDVRGRMTQLPPAAAAPAAAPPRPARLVRLLIALCAIEAVTLAGLEPATA